MKISTKYHGDVEMEEKDLIFFQNGLPGFIGEKEFVLLPLESDSPLLILQSVKSKDLGFIMINPFNYFHSYEFELSKPDKDFLEIHSESDITILTIITVKEPFEDSTVNLMAPIIINVKNKKAKQVILNNSIYNSRTKLFNGLK
ncbi:flagellar assembly protein FliW [Metabacillus sp. HB246100]